MGYDVTFHPISAEELEHWVLDVVRHPALAGERAETVSIEPRHQKAVAYLYSEFPGWLQSSLEISATIGFSAASIAGFLHPYWYARNSGISLLPPVLLERIAPLVRPWSRFPVPALQMMHDPGQGFFETNYQGAERGRIFFCGVGGVVLRCCLCPDRPASRRWDTTIT